MRHPFGEHHDDDSFHAELTADYAGAVRQLSGIGNAVAFFGSARVGEEHPYFRLVEAVARRVGEAGRTILTGSGGGFMEAANRGAKAAGAHSIGLNIVLPREQRPNAFVDRTVVFRAMAMRKVMFVRYASGFVVAPGGFGTMDEVFEILTLMQTRKVARSPIVMLGEDYWRGLWQWTREQMVSQKLVDEADLGMFTVTDDVETAVKALGL